MTCPPGAGSRDLLSWGVRIDQLTHDGDILVAPYPAGFAVVWRNGAFVHLQGKERGDLVAPNAFQRKLHRSTEWGLHPSAGDFGAGLSVNLSTNSRGAAEARPAEYAHIPDVVNERANHDGGHIWSTLAVGLVLTWRACHSADAKAANPAT